MPTAADVAIRRGRFHQCRRCGTNAWLEHSEYAKVGGKSLPHPCREETTEQVRLSEEFGLPKMETEPRRPGSTTSGSTSMAPNGEFLKIHKNRHQRPKPKAPKSKGQPQASCSAREPNRLNQRLASAPWRLPQWIYSRTSPSQRSRGCRTTRRSLCKRGQRAVAVSEHNNSEHRNYSIRTTRRVDTAHHTFS